ncbi:MAG: GDSL-type esterase/lipase family protein [Prevotellaceae bacterium]|jgi:lysophospholipase L1-like esterase|nr:GDSL-type esterase/lipase family protein [Prevotellaceae bacterium]
MRNLIWIFFSFLCLPLHAQIAERATYLNDIKVELTKQWPENRTVNLVFHGHSVPSGYFKTPNVCTLNAYPQLVLQAVKEAYPYAVVNAISTAIGGENAEQGAVRFRQEVLTHRPDVLFIDYALNDRSIGLERAGTAWETMIKEALDANVKVILMTPTPDMTVDVLDGQSSLEKHARQIRELAAKYHTGLVDSYAAFQEKKRNGDDIETYMSQVNHPNEKGHRTVVDSIIPWLTNERETAQIRPEQFPSKTADIHQTNTYPLQAPSHLTTDMLEHTDRVFLDGYPSNISLTELGTAVERYQLTEIRNGKPYLGWAVNSSRPNTLQTAYRIMLASSPKLLDKNEADLWDSDRTESDNSVAVPYSGKPLQPSTVYYWKVKVWDNYGDESPYSQVKCFATAGKFDGVTARYPLQIVDEYPSTITPLAENRFMVDFGNASFGRLKLTLFSGKETDTLVIHLGESIKNGQVNRKPGGTVRYAEYRLPLMKGTHTYSLKIKPDKRNATAGTAAILMPDYTGEVLPFRYCELENCHTPLLHSAGHNIVRQTVYYPFDGTASMFRSSDTVLNRVWEMCKYSVKATSFPGIFVDGDRERIPYEGDVVIGQLSRYVVDRRYEFSRFSYEYLVHNPTWPTEWNLQAVLLAWADYMYTGNPVSLQKFYDDLKAKTLSGLTESNGLISTKTGKMTGDFLKSIHFRGSLGDIVDWPTGERDGYVFTDYNTVVNAYHYQSLRLMSAIAGVLGKTQEQSQFAGDAQRVKNQMNKLLFDTERGIYRDGTDTDHVSLHASMYPLAFGITPEKYRQKTLDFIRSRGLACSVYGAQALVDAVYDAGDAGYGLKLLSSTDERSWYNMIRQGSTIAMEAWDDRFKPNQDWNHIWGAAAGNHIVRKLMGIEPIEPGFKKFRIKPQPATLKHAEVKTPSIRGDIHVSFDNRNAGHFVLDVDIPANTTAEIMLPKPSKKYSLTADGIPQKGTVNGDFVTVEAGSGKHRLVITGQTK